MITWSIELAGLRRVNNPLQKQLEVSEALERSNRNLEAFAAIVTHDLRNPMTEALFMPELANESSRAGDAQLASIQLDVVFGPLRTMSRFVGVLHAQPMSREKKAKAA